MALIEFSHLSTLPDANLWGLVPVLEVECRVDAQQRPVSEVSESLIERIRCEAPADAQADLVACASNCTSIAELMAKVTLGLQRIAGCPVSFTAVDNASATGTWRFAIEFEEDLLVRDCLHVSRELCLAVIADQPFELAREIERLRDVAYFNCLGPSTRTIMDAARSRGIPVRRLGTGSLLQLGHGSRQRRVFTGETDRTGAIAETIAHDKELTRELLQKVGVPVPRGRPAASAEDAFRAVEEYGGPIVVKPRDANHGRGVSMRLMTQAEIAVAFDAALKEGYDGVLVEEFIEGDEYRLLVVNGRLVAAALREPAQVRGDGRQTVAELVAEENRSPLRGDGFLTPLKTIEIDAVALNVLAEQELTTESIPTAGTRVYIRRNINYFNGGTAVDVTCDVHPEVAECAVEAARMIGLDIAGIDLKVQDISRPLQEQRGTVIEVNAGPGLQMHLPPSAPEHPVGGVIVSHLFPPADDGRIPLVAILDEEHGAEIAGHVAELLSRNASSVGVSCSLGDSLCGRSVTLPGTGRSQKSRSMLLNSSVDVAVLEIDAAEVRESGFGFDRCTIVVLNDDPEGQIASRLIGTIEIDGWVIVPADSVSLSSQSAFNNRGKVLFSCSETHTALVAHRNCGGAVVFLRNGHAVLAIGERHEHAVPLDLLPWPLDTSSPGSANATLAAIAAAWAVRDCSLEHPLAIASPAA